MFMITVTSRGSLSITESLILATGWQGKFPAQFPAQLSQYHIFTFFTHCNLFKQTNKTNKTKPINKHPPTQQSEHASDKHTDMSLWAAGKI